MLICEGRGVTNLAMASCHFKQKQICWYELFYADDTTLMAESEEELEPLDENERGE